MLMMSFLREHRAAAAATLVILLGRVFAVAPIEALHGEMPEGAALQTGWFTFIAAPLVLFWDRLALMDVEQLVVFGIFLLGVWPVWAFVRRSRFAGARPVLRSAGIYYSAVILSVGKRIQ